MSNDTNYIDNNLPRIFAAWLNDVNVAIYRALGSTGLAGGTPPITPAQVLANLGANAAASQQSIFLRQLAGNLTNADAALVLGNLGGTNQTYACTTTGTANAITLTPNVTIRTGLLNYMRFSFVANFTSSAAVTITVAGLTGALNVITPDTSYPVAAYDIENGNFYEVCYVNGSFVLTSAPQSVGQAMTNEATIRIASNATAQSYQVSYYGGNGLYVWNAASTRWEFHKLPGTFPVVNTTNCTVNGTTGQALAASTRYYIYAYLSGGAIAFDHSTTAPVGGDPLGSTSVTGFMFKTGDISRRLIGGVGTDASQNIWASAGAYPNGVKQSNMGSYYQRQRLNLQIVPSASALSNTTWATITNAKLTAWLWGDGAEPTVTAMLSVQGNTAGTTIYAGISVDGEATPGSNTLFVVPSANYAVAVALTCPCGNLADGVHTFEIKMQISSGAATYSIVNAPAFCLNVTQ